jgi:D-amino peptidase
MTLAPQHVVINGRRASEFMIYSLCAAYEGVPSVFLSGDKALCNSSEELYPWLTTVAVKEGCGLSTIAMAPKKARRLIREKVQTALCADFSAMKYEMPKQFAVDIEYKDQNKAKTNSYFPGVEQTDSHTIHFEDSDYFEIARKLKFLL